MMFWHRKDNVRINKIETDVLLLQAKLKVMMDLLETLEIKILESKKVYQRKLKNLVEVEDKTDNNINQSVLLGPNGSPV